MAHGALGMGIGTVCGFKQQWMHVRTIVNKSRFQFSAVNVFSYANRIALWPQSSPLGIPRVTSPTSRAPCKPHDDSPAGRYFALFPMSRRHPHFNREHPGALAAGNWHRIRLGKRSWRTQRGRQMPADQSPNVALRDPSFRNYGDYMLSGKILRSRSASGRASKREPILPSCALSCFIFAAIACAGL